MKKIVSVISLAALLIGVTACERENFAPDGGINPDFKVTATIEPIENTTRVGYTVDNTENTVTPEWQVDDQIFGFDSEGNTFTYRVSAVDGVTKEATLALVGEYTPVSASKAYAIYYPGKTVLNFEGSGAARTLAVDLSAQSGALNTSSPVLMCATADITPGGINFSFQNQTAVIGVKAFQLPEAATITSMDLNGVITTGTFSVDEGVLKLTPKGSPTKVTATGSWETADDGGNQKVKTGVYFASLPTASANLVLDASSSTKTYANVTAIPSTSLTAGNYYYMSKVLGERVAAIGTTTYTTIDAAWTAANAATSDVIVTLLANCSAANQLLLNDTGSGEITLDLNGKTLSINKQLLVKNGRVLTIDDSVDGGEINSTYTGGSTVYANASVINLYGGTLTNSSSLPETKYAIYYSGTSSGRISGGTINAHGSAIYLSNTSDSLIITGGFIKSELNYGIYNAGSRIEVRGGTVNSYNKCFYHNGDSLIITGGIFHSEAQAVATSYNEGTAIWVNGGYFSSKSTSELITQGDKGVAWVTSGYFDRPINSRRTYTNGGATYRGNTLNTSVETKDAYPFRVGNYTRYLIEKTASYNYYHRTLASAAKQANSLSEDVTVELRLDYPEADAAVFTNPDHEITLDLKGFTLSTVTASFLSSAKRFTITSSSAGGKISSTKNNVISITNENADVTISNCIITSSCAKGAENSTVRTIYQTNGQISISNAEIVSDNSTAIRVSGGITTFEDTKLTAELYGVYCAGNANVTFKNDNNSVYSNSLRAVFSANENARIAIEGGHYYTGKGNALSADNTTIGPVSYTITGGYFKTVSTNLNGCTGYSNITTLGSPEVYSHDADHTGLSYPYGYVAP